MDPIRLTEVSRRTFMALVSGSLLAAPLAAEAQQAGKSRTPIGVEGIKRLLTSHERWTLYWHRSDMGSETGRPRFGSKSVDRSWSARLEFMRFGQRFVGHAEMIEFHSGMECEFDVRVREIGLTIVPCWPGEDTPLTYDPEDSEYPFKGRNGGTLFWLAPLR